MAIEEVSVVIILHRVLSGSSRDKAVINVLYIPHDFTQKTKPSSARQDLDNNF